MKASLLTAISTSERRKCSATKKSSGRFTAYQPVILKAIDRAASLPRALGMPAELRLFCGRAAQRTWANCRTPNKFLAAGTKQARIARLHR